MLYFVKLTVLCQVLIRCTTIARKHAGKDLQQECKISSFRENTKTDLHFLLLQQWGHGGNTASLWICQGEQLEIFKETENSCTNIIQSLSQFCNQTIQEYQVEHLIHTTVPIVYPGILGTLLFIETIFVVFYILISCVSMTCKGRYKNHKNVHTILPKEKARIDCHPINVTCKSYNSMPKSRYAKRASFGNIVNFIEAKETNIKEEYADYMQNFEITEIVRTHQPTFSHNNGEKFCDQNIAEYDGIRLLTCVESDVESPLQPNSETSSTCQQNDGIDGNLHIIHSVTEYINDTPILSHRQNEFLAVCKTVMNTKPSIYREDQKLSFSRISAKKVDVNLPGFENDDTAFLRQPVVQNNNLFEINEDEERRSSDDSSEYSFPTASYSSASPSLSSNSSGYDEGSDTRLV